jgi:hypothetical protein
MAEHDEHPPAEGARPSAETPAAAEPATRPAASEGPPPPAETITRGSSARGDRFRRWSRNGAVRLGATAIVAGLIGGLVGGGIVAAFSDDGGHDRYGGPVMFQRNMPGGPPGFRAPRYWGQPPYGRSGPNGRRLPQQQPTPPAQPTPVPSPKATG